MSGVEVNSKIDSIATDISNLSLLEAAALAEKLKDLLGVQDMPMILPSAGALVGAGVEQAQPAKKEKTSFDLYLKSCGDQKTKVIKVVRDICKEQGGAELGLKEVKDLVEKAPVQLCSNIAKDVYDKYCQLLKEAGAVPSDE